MQFTDEHLKAVLDVAKRLENAPGNYKLVHVEAPFLVAITEELLKRRAASQEDK